MRSRANIIGLLLLAGIILATAGCKKKDEDKQQNYNQFTVKYAMGDKDFVFFSLKTGERVDITEEQSLTSNEWDFAILSKCIKTNGGASTSGDAQGAAAETDISIDDLSTMTLPKGLTFEEDKMGRVGMMNDPERESGRNELLINALGFDHSQGGPMFNPSKKVFIIRGNDGTHYAFAFGAIGTFEKTFLYRKLD